MLQGRYTRIPAYPYTCVLYLPVVDLSRTKIRYLFQIRHRSTADACDIAPADPSQISSIEYKSNQIKIK